MSLQSKKRLTVQRAAEANERGQRAIVEDTVLRRSLASSSLGRERVGDPPASTPAPAHPEQKYKQDSEAYKRRESPKKAIMALLKKHTSIDGHRIR